MGNEDAMGVDTVKPPRQRNKHEIRSGDVQKSQGFVRKWGRITVKAMCFHWEQPWLSVELCHVSCVPLDFYLILPNWISYYHGDKVFGIYPTIRLPFMNMSNPPPPKKKKNQQKKKHTRKKTTPSHKDFSTLVSP